jgi:tetratricopeptide (TPR) repeat protein
MRALPLVLALLPGIAFASPKPAWYAAGPGSVELASAVDVDLIRSPDTQFLPAVWATLPKAAPKDGEPVPATLAVIDLASSSTTVSPGAAGALGLKIKGKEGDQFTTIPRIEIGGMVLHDVPARVTGTSALVIGAATLDTVAVAVMASEGKVKLVPSADAAALLAGIGDVTAGTRIPAKKYFDHGNKLWGNGVALTVPGQVLGADGQIRVDTATWASGVRADVGFDPMRTVAGLPETVTSPTVAGAVLGQAWVRHDGGIVDPDATVVARIGYGALYAADLAVDGASGQLAIRPATDPKAASGADLMLADAKTSYEFAIAQVKPDDKPPADTAGGDDGKPAIAGPEGAYAAALLAAGKTDEALTHFHAATAVAGDHCDAYLAEGEALIAAGKASDAIAPLTKAGELWDRWYAQDLATRTRIGKHKKVGEGAFTIVQPGACHVAWGSLASAYLAAGQGDQIDALYAKHVDLDASLPMAYGLALLLRGQPDAANGPIRRALNDGDPDQDVRSALSLAHADAAAMPVIDRQADRIAPKADDYGFDALLPVIEAARLAGGDAAAAALAQRLADADPLSVQAPLLSARETHRAGEKGTLDLQLAALDKRVAAFVASQPNGWVGDSYRAVLAALHGDKAGAVAILDASSAAHGEHPELASARIVVASIAGDKAAVDKQVAAMRARNPLSASGFLKTGG